MEPQLPPDEVAEIHKKIKAVLEQHAPGQVGKLPVLLGSGAFKDKPGKLLRMLEQRYKVGVGGEKEGLVRKRILKMLVFYGKGKTQEEAGAQMKKLLAADRFKDKEQALLESLIRKYGPEPDTFPVEEPQPVRDKIVPQAEGNILPPPAGVADSTVKAEQLRQQQVRGIIASNSSKPPPSQPLPPAGVASSTSKPGQPVGGIIESGSSSPPLLPADVAGTTSKPPQQLQPQHQQDEIIPQREAAAATHRVGGIIESRSSPPPLLPADVAGVTSEHERQQQHPTKDEIIPLESISHTAAHLEAGMEVKKQIVELVMKHNEGRTEAEAVQQVDKILESNPRSTPEELLAAMRAKYASTPVGVGQQSLVVKDKLITLLMKHGLSPSKEDAAIQVEKLLLKNPDTTPEELLAALKAKYSDGNAVKKQIVELIMKHNEGRTEAEAVQQVDKLLLTERYAGKEKTLLTAVRQKYGVEDDSEVWAEKCAMLVQLHAPGDMGKLAELVRHPKYEGGYQGLYDDLKKLYVGGGEGEMVVSVGDRVKLCNLVKAEELNGGDAIVLEVQNDDVCLVKIGGVGEKLLKRKNIRPVTHEESEAWTKELLLDHTTRLLKVTRHQNHARNDVVKSETDEQHEIAMQIDENLQRILLNLTEAESFTRLLHTAAENHFISNDLIPMHDLRRELTAAREHELCKIDLLQEEINERYEIEDEEASGQLRMTYNIKEGFVVMVSTEESMGRARLTSDATTIFGEISREEQKTRPHVVRIYETESVVSDEEDEEQQEEHEASPSPSFRDKMLKFYGRMFPGKDNSTQVDVMLERYAGREDDLADALEAKYGRRLDGPDHYEKLLKIYEKHAAEKIPTISAVLENYRGREEDLFDTLAQRYDDKSCLLKDDSSIGRETGWESRLAEIKKINPTLDISVADLTTKYSACAEQILTKLEERYADPNASFQSALAHQTGPPTLYLDRLRKFYTKYAPEKVPTVESSLRTYRGKEEELFEMLVAAYGPEPVDSDSSGEEEEYEEEEEEEEEARRLAAKLMGFSNEFQGREDDLLDAVRRRLRGAKDEPSTKTSSSLRVCDRCGQRSTTEPPREDCSACGKTFSERVPIKAVPGHTSTTQDKIEETFISGCFLWYRNHPAVSTGPTSWKKAWFQICNGALLRKRENSNSAKTTTIIKLEKIFNVIGYDLAPHESPPVPRCRHFVFAATLNSPLEGTRWYTQLLLCAESMQMKRQWMSGLKAALSSIVRPTTSKNLTPHDVVGAKDCGMAVSPPRRTAPEVPTVRVFYMCEGVSRWGACFAHVEGSFFCTVTHCEGDAADQASQYLYFPLSLLQSVDWVKATYLLPPVGTHGTGLRLQFRRKSIYITSSLKSTLHTMKLAVFDGMRDDDAVHPAYYSPCSVKGGLPTCFPLPSHGVCPTKIVPRTWEASLDKVVKQETVTRKKLLVAESEAWAVVRKGPPQWLVTTYHAESRTRHDLTQDEAESFRLLSGRFAEGVPSAEGLLPLTGLSPRNSTADGLSLRVKKARLSVGWAPGNSELPSP